MSIQQTVFGARWLLSGVLATLTMDLGAALARRAGLTAGLPPALLGRWFAGVLHGRFAQDTILEAPASRGEVPLALTLHYAIGVALTCAFLGLLASCPDAPPKPFSWALAFGLFTNLLPWLLMFPSMGFGVLGLRGPSELLLLRSSLVNHLLFGLGLGLALRWLSPLP